jgi:hypothetical protein
MKINATSERPGLTVHCRVNFGAGAKGQMKLNAGPLQTVPAAASGRVPRVARLMALALRFDELLRRGEVKDYADLARLGHVTRARVTQVMNLLMLALDLQEALLFLPAVDEGRDPVKEWQVRPIAAEPVWTKQRQMWHKMSGNESGCLPAGT